MWSGVDGIANADGRILVSGAPGGVAYRVSAAVLLVVAYAPPAGAAQARGEIGIALGERPELV